MSKKAGGRRGKKSGDGSLDKMPLKVANRDTLSDPMNEKFTGLITFDPAEAKAFKEKEC